MSSTPKVQFENIESARRPTDQEIENKVAQGRVSNTALSIYQATKRPGFGAPVPYAQRKFARRLRPGSPHHPIEVSDPGIDRSDETAVAINPRNPRNIVAGAISFNGSQFENTAYVSKDAGNTWTTVIALTNANEGAGIAFDDSGNCYYTTMQGGFFPVCIVSQDGGLTWSAPAAFGFGDKTAVAARGTTHFPVGSSQVLGGKNTATLVFETGRPARIDGYADASGPLGDNARERGVTSSVATPIIVEGRLWGAIGAGSTGERPLPPDTEARLADFTELVATAIANAESRAALAASRARLVAAADESRRRIERDLHDGAQQRLVHAVIVLKLALRALSDGDVGASEMVAEALRHAEEANAELRELAHGILPAALTRGGLRAGVEALVSRVSLPVSVDVPAERLPASVEATAYFVVSEALTNVVKHAHAAGASVTARVESGELRVEVRDDGVGGAHGGHSTGLGGLEDRVSALDGRLVVESPPDGGTRVCARLPVAASV